MCEGSICAEQLYIYMYMVGHLGQYRTQWPHSGRWYASLQLPGQLQGANSQTYNWDSMLVGNYANTLLHTSFEFPTYIRHGSSKNLFANVDDELFDHQGHLKDTIPTGHEVVVRVFLTQEELQLLMDSVPKWDMAGAIPCTTKY